MTAIRFESSSCLLPVGALNVVSKMLFRYTMSNCPSAYSFILPGNGPGVQWYTDRESIHYCKTGTMSPESYKDRNYKKLLISVRSTSDIEESIATLLHWQHFACFKCLLVWFQDVIPFIGNPSIQWVSGHDGLRTGNNPIKKEMIPIKRKSTNIVLDYLIHWVSRHFSFRVDSGGLLFNYISHFGKFRFKVRPAEYGV